MPLLKMMETEDREELADFFGRMEMDAPWEGDGIRRQLTCWKVTHGCEGYIAGAVALGRSEGNFFLEEIAVDYIYRKMKLGKIMLDKVVRTVRCEGGSVLYAEVEDGRFFEKNGFVAAREGAPANMMLEV
ncbi:MAG: GNAT family N-acetyltransferase [Anaerovoracaceae bacterium]|jgi:N-acetylglutamate synthase-like GNAT family acetyltransferase